MRQAVKSLVEAKADARRPFFSFRARIDGAEFGEIWWYFNGILMDFLMESLMGFTLW